MYTSIMDLDQQAQYQKQLWREAEQRHLAQIAQNQNKQSSKPSITKRFATILTMMTLSR